MMITPPMSTFCFTLLFLWSMASAQVTDQFSSSNLEEVFVSANLGGNLTLKCSNEKSFAKLFWYKQRLGEKPRLISTLCATEQNNVTIHDKENNQRFTLDGNNLTITNLSASDSACYYCIRLMSENVEPDRIVFVSVKDSGLTVQALVHQSPSQTDQQENSAILSCTIHTGNCGGEHSVYWFRVSGGSQPGLIYTQGGKQDQCERKNNTQTHTCVYNLPMKSLNLSSAGTYYCAVAACGHILFGSGTKLDVQCISTHKRNTLVYLLDGAVAVVSILFALLSVSVYRIRGQSKERPSGFARSTNENVEADGEKDDIHYAAVSISLPNRLRRQRKSTDNECMYSSVK